MNVTINGKTQTFDANISVADMIAAIYDSDKGIAVAINNTLVPRAGWATRQLEENDDIVIIKAAYGG